MKSDFLENIKLDKLNLSFTNADWKRSPEDCLGELVQCVYDDHMKNCCRSYLLEKTTTEFDPVKGWENGHTVLVPLTWDGVVEPLWRFVQNMTNLFETPLEDRFFAYLEQNCEHVVFNSMGTDTIPAYLENHSRADFALLVDDLPLRFVGSVTGPRRFRNHFNALGRLQLKDGTSVALLQSNNLPDTTNAFLLPLPVGHAVYHDPVWHVVERDGDRFVKVVFRELYQFRWGAPLSRWTKV